MTKSNIDHFISDQTYKHSLALLQLQLRSPIVHSPILPQSNDSAIWGAVDLENGFSMAQGLDGGRQSEGYLFGACHRLLLLCVLQLHVRAELILHAQDGTSKTMTTSWDSRCIAL